MVETKDITLAINSYSRPLQLSKTLEYVLDFPNIQVIVDGGDVGKYYSVIERYKDRVRFIINEKNIGVASTWNRAIISSKTQYVILSGDDLVFPSGWSNGLLDLLNEKIPPLQVSLSYPMSFSCFRIDKRLIALQGWFDQNFTIAYYEDEDWYLRFRERMELYNNSVPYEEIIPQLRTVIRNSHGGIKWNVIPNYVYFHWKWKKEEKSTTINNSLHSRQNILYKRRLKEPLWLEMEKVRMAYKEGDFSEKKWEYITPRWELRLLTSLTKNRFFFLLRNWDKIRGMNGRVT